MTTTNGTLSLPFTSILAESPFSPTITLLTAIVLLSGIIFGASALQKPGSPTSSEPILDDNGTPIPHFDEDTRFSRFSHGKEIGDRLTKELGDMWTWRAGEGKELVLTTPDQIRSYYRDALGRDESKAHVKALGAQFGDYMRRFLGQSMGFKFGQDWRRIRDAVDPHFVRRIALDTIPRLVGDFDIWIDGLPKHEAAKPIEGKPGAFEISAIMATRELPFKSIAKSIYGETLTEEWYQKLWGLHPTHDRVMAAAITNQNATKSWYKFLPTQANRDLKSFHDGLRKFNESIIAESERLGHDTVAQRMYATVQDGLISAPEFHQSIDEILFANIDITSVAQAWLLVDLGLYQDVQEKLRDELKGLDVKDETAVETYLGNVSAQASEGKEGEWMEAVLRETARTRPVLWYNIPEIVSVPKKIGSYNVPAGTSVCISTYHLNTNPSVWGPTSKTYDPARFLPGGSAPPTTAYRHALFRYGLGPRQCLGKNFAGIIVKLVALKALPKYKIEVVGNVDVDRRGFAVTPDVTLRFTPL